MTTIRADDPGLPPSKYLCLTILGFKNPKLTEEQYRRHMIEISAPLTKDLMNKYGIKRWTVTHNLSETRNLVTSMYDKQMATVAQYDCFSQVVLESLDHYLAMKQDPWYKSHLFGDHEKFADIRKTIITVGWIEEWVNDGKVRQDMNEPWVSFKNPESVAAEDSEEREANAQLQS